MASFVIDEVSEQCLPEWQAFVDSRDDAQPMHHAAWHPILRESTTVKPRFMVARTAGGALCGVLPAYSSRSLLSGYHITSFDGGALSAEPAAADALIRHLHDRARAEGAGYLLLRGGSVAACDRDPREHISVVSVVDTSFGEDEIFRRIKKKTRWEVRRGHREGFTVRIDQDCSEIEAFYRLYAAHVHRLGTPVMGLKLMQAMIRHLGPERLKLLLLERGREIVGGMLIVIGRGTWLDLYALVRHDLRPTAANYVLYAEALRTASQQGAIELSLGRSRIGSGVHAFKLKWGAVDQPLIYRYYAGRGGKVSGLESYRDAETRAQRLWKRLPLWAANRLGPLIRRQLPFV